MRLRIDKFIPNYNIRGTNLSVNILLSKVVFMANILITHISRDSAFVSGLSIDLRDLGHKVASSEWHLNQFLSEPKADDSYEFIITVISKEAISSGWLENNWRESYWKFVEDNSSLLIPILIDDSRIPEFLNEYEYLYFDPHHYSFGYAELIKILSKDLPVPSSKEIVIEKISKLVSDEAISENKEEIVGLLINDSPPQDSEISDRFILWHPDVHNFYSEQLYIFLISAEGFDGSLKEAIQQALKSCNIAGWCLYYLYGSYDVLVRAWMTLDQKQRFTHCLDDFDSKILDRQSFGVNNIDYLWHGSISKLEEKIINKHPIEKLKSAQDSQCDDAYLEILRSEGLILDQKKAHSFEDIKFYIALSYRTNNQNIDVLSVLRDFLKDDNNVPSSIKNLTIYTVEEGNRFFIKGTTGFNNLYDISNFTLKLISKHKSYKMKSSTMLVATRSNPESDNINFDYVKLSHGMKRIVSAMDLKETDIFPLDKYAHREIQDIFERIADKDLITDYVEVFKPFFRGYVTQNEEAIISNLVFQLSDFERNLRNYAIQNLVEACGPHWVKSDHFLIIRKEVQIEETKPIDKLAIQDWLSILGKLNSEEGMVDGQLQENWEKTLQGAREYRNKLFHGRYEKGDWLKEWSNVMLFLIDYLPIYGRLNNN